MSGRLIILPKKSWHPGKRENIERVLRDERLAEEEAAAARERAREIAQEGIVETLTKNRSASEKSKDQGGASSEARTAHKRKRQGEDDQALGGKGQGWGATLQHVNLFSDAEREAGKILGQNADHQREKKEQELRTQQRSGLAPTALGEGSAELKDKDAQPWYTQPQPSSRGQEVVARTVRLGREVTGQEAEEAIRRDQGRKGQADPMGSLFRSGAQTGDKAGNLLLPQASTTELLGAAGAEFGQAAERSDGKEPRGKNKKTKKGKREKKEKKQKRRKSKDRRRGGHSQDDSSKEHPAGEDEARDDRHAAMRKLRERRLAREGGERERQIRLLAEREMAGQSLPDERSRAYNNQYNAPAARQNRNH